MKKLTKNDLWNKKFNILIDNNIELSKTVQKILFNLGFSWNGNIGDKGIEITNYDVKIFTIGYYEDGFNLLTYSNYGCDSRNNSFITYKAEDLIKSFKGKLPKQSKWKKIWKNN